MRYSLRRWPKWYSWFTLPLVLPLIPLVVFNLEKRRKGQLPDEWYWADYVMMRLGWSVY